MLVAPRAIAAQNRWRCSRRPTGRRPGERIAGRPVRSDAQPFGLPIATLLDQALRRPLESALFSEWINNPGPSSAADLVNAFESTDGVGDDNGYAGYLAVQCTDTAWPNSWSKIVRDNWFVNAVAPFETWGNAWFNGPCTNWPGRPDRPVQINGSRVNSALLIDETLDAATPFPGSLEVRKLFPRASLIAEPGGTSHADSLFGDTCVDGSIADYLTTGALPARQRFAPWDKTCAPLPQPDPTQQVSANAARSAKAGVGRAAQAAQFTRATGGRLRLAAVLSR